MSKKITRRQLLAAGAASTGILLGTGCESTPPQETRQVQKPTGPGREPFWMPGPDKNLVRDLTPGPTPIRLSGYLFSVNIDAEGNPIGESTTNKENVGPGDLVRKLREAGLTAAFTMPEYFFEATDSMVRELKAALKQHDMIIFEVGGYRNLLHTDESKRQENIKLIAESMEFAERIGCPMLGTISGSRNPESNEWRDNYAVHPDNWTLETWNLLIDSLNQILKDTEGMNVVIGIEAQVTTNIDSPLAHKRLMEDMGSERIKVNLDPTNMCHLYNHFHTTELINECFDLLGEDIVGCHAKDTYVLPHSQTVHVQEVCPGRGNLDYETYLVRLSHMKWIRTLSVEHIPDDQFPEAWAYIRKVAGNVGVKIYGDA